MTPVTHSHSYSRHGTLYIGLAVLQTEWQGGGGGAQVDEGLSFVTHGEFATHFLHL